MLDALKLIACCLGNNDIGHPALAIGVLDGIEEADGTTLRLADGLQSPSASSWYRAKLSLPCAPRQSI